MGDLSVVGGEAEDDDFGRCDEGVFALTDKGCFAGFEGGSGFPEMEDQAGQGRGELTESRVLDQHGFEEDRDGMRL